VYSTVLTDIQTSLSGYANLIFNCSHKLSAVVVKPLFLFNLSFVSVVDLISLLLCQLSWNWDISPVECLVPLGFVCIMELGCCCSGMSGTDRLCLYCGIGDITVVECLVPLGFVCIVEFCGVYAVSECMSIL
jgi:hypothetical protein